MTLDLGIIRRQRYVSNVTAANITTSTYAQGGTITSYTYSGTTYIAHIFTVSGIFTVTSDIYPLEFIAVAGGGGGGNNAGTNAGGGGGGGGIVTNGVLNTINRVFPSAAYIAATTATVANIVGGWVGDSVFSDFNGSGAFHFFWRAIQQTAGGARTSIIPEIGAYNLNAPQQYYMEIGITAIGPVDVAVGLIRDGYPKDGYANMPYLNLNGGTVTGWQAAGGTALGTFVAGDTLQIAWDSQYQDGRGTYWWAGKNNTWYSTPFSDYTNVALTTGTYQANALRMIFMSAASGGGGVRGEFRPGNENKYPAPNNSGAVAVSTITDYSGYYKNPLGSNYISSGSGITFGVTIGAGGGVGSYNPSPQVGAPGSNGGDTIIYNTTNPSYYYSTYFSNSYITATNAAFAFGTSDFTIETWLYPTSSYGKQSTNYNIRPIFNSRNFVNPDVSDRGFIVYLDYVNKVTIFSSSTTYINSINTVTNAAWNHVAVSRTNNVINVWINGVKDKSSFVTTASTTFSNFTNTNIMIGYGSRNNDLTQAHFFTGYFSNYRILKGVSAYNPGFQGLAAPLTATQSNNVKGTPSVAIAGTLTSLLMLTTSTSGIFYDSSLGTTATLTNNGVVTASGLGPGTYSGSLSFNGTTQYLRSLTSTAFTFGTGDFTVEYWVYYNALTAGTTYAICGSGRTSGGYFFGSLGFIPYMSTSARGYQATPGATFKLQQWTHVAWVRNTSVAPGVNVYLNGSWSGYLDPFPGPTPDNIIETGFTIGARGDPAFYTNAYISNIRVVKGLAVYTNRGNFTPPTTISSATQSTSTDFIINAITTQTVLLTFNSSTIVDLSTLSNVLTQTSGTVSISTFAPFTTSTVLFRAFGGGGGGAPYQNNGQAGGSGGGAPGGGFGGLAIPGQGNRGGQGSTSLGCGGGGFAYPGGPAVNDGTFPYPGNPAGRGGAGGYFNHSGAMVAYSGGGGGGAWNSSSWDVGRGGVGGGGNGAYYNLSSVLIPAIAGTINSGGGGGGSNLSNANAAAGGSGIVIFRYPAFIGDAARFPSDLTDSNLKNTTLLLSSSRSIGTENTNNRNIVDSSYNLISILTATTTIAQGTFSPYGSNWSTSFNGSTDYLLFSTTGTAFAQNTFFGANKTFTIEAWLNPNGFQLSSTSTVILGDALPIAAGLAWSVGLDSLNKPMMYWRDIVGNKFITATTAISTGTWNHVAWVSNAGTPTIFINGINQLLTNSSISTLTNTTQTFGMVIGANFNRFYNGSISNLKVSTGALYSTNTSFLPPTAPFNTPANTILLTCNNYRHSDISTSSIAITTGTITSIPKIQKYSPFAMGYPYNPLSIGGSAFFNGGTDFIYTNTLTTTATSLQLDSDFTIECWVYTTATTAQCIFDTAGISGNILRPNAFSLNTTATSELLYFSYNNTNSPLSSRGITPFTWNHIAVTRTSGVMSIFQNGIITLSVSTTTNFSAGQMIIGKNGQTTSSYFSGFISDFRVVKGTSIYTNAFNPPVAPLKPIDETLSTSLLLNFNNSAISDTTMNHNVIVVNSTTFTSGVTKYNPRSIYFPGVIDYLTVIPNSTSSYALGSSDFTVEMWAYILPVSGWANVSNLQPATYRSLFDMRSTNTANAGFDIALGNTGILNVNTLGLGYITGTTFLSVSTWHHIALVRGSNSFNLYLNGIPEGSTYTSATIPNFINPTVRIGFGAGGAGYFNGYIDDLRITRGVARYSYPGFLIPQKALPVK